MLEATELRADVVPEFAVSGLPPPHMGFARYRSRYRSARSSTVLGSDMLGFLPGSSLFETAWSYRRAAARASRCENSGYRQVIRRCLPPTRQRSAKEREPSGYTRRPKLGRAASAYSARPDAGGILMQAASQSRRNGW